MAKLNEAMRSILLDDSAVAAVVGTRIFPAVVPQGQTLPAIAYQRISGPRLHTTGGPTGCAHPRIQYACHAITYDAAKDLANLVREALDGYSGTKDDVIIQSIQSQNEIDNYNQEPDAHASTFTVWVDFVVWHQETP